MNAPLHLSAAPPLHRVALAALADRLATAPASAERDWIAAESADVTGEALQQWIGCPAEGDELLHALCNELGCGLAESIAIALAVAVEFDPMLSRVVAWLQAPAGGARPTLGLLHSITEMLGLPRALADLLDGPARAAGVLQIEAASRPLPELAFQVPVPLALVLRDAGGGATAATAATAEKPAKSAKPERVVTAGTTRTTDTAATVGTMGTAEASRGRLHHWPGLPTLRPADAVPPSLAAAAEREAQALLHGGGRGGGGVLAVRSGHPREARQAAALVARAMGARAVAVEHDPPAGFGAWLWLCHAVPVLCAELAPGETRRLPELPGYRGPLLAACGMEGSFEREGDPVASWQVPLPTPAERAALWGAHVAPDIAERLGRQHRHSAAHIAHLARAARRQAQLSDAAAADQSHVHAASRAGAAGELGTLAQLVRDEVTDDAMVATPGLRAALAALRQRCESRERLAEGLGPAARTRYRPGVRALLVGPSGTGKTLAAGWLATVLGMPLYRVDLASVSSKYIGETEKNLAQLFARAEHAEVVLLFDEADALFGKRTELKDSNDRFANQQTNYLLQRIESFEGIAVLTSNSRSRFDSAFTRRLDTIIDFPAPGPDERRALWMAHLGDRHGLDIGELNRLAACCDLAGGHIRNVTLAASARTGGAPVTLDTLRCAVEAEYRKLGRQMPAGL